MKRFGYQPPPDPSYKDPDPTLPLGEFRSSQAESMVSQVQMKEGDWRLSARKSVGFGGHGFLALPR